ncbi:hypothetical protein FMO13_13420 [Xanthomonas phaseoli pv. dieffenbachiae]
MGNGEWGMGNGEWGMGNGEWGMGNGEWGIGNRESQNQRLGACPDGSVSQADVNQKLQTRSRKDKQRPAPALPIPHSRFPIHGSKRYPAP